MAKTHRIFRRNPQYQSLAGYLESEGYQFEPVFGGKHPYIVVQLPGKAPLKMHFPATPGDQRGGYNAVSTLKRLIRERLGAA